jgi:hypothetical protein
MRISAYPFVQNDVFLKVPYVLLAWDFVPMYLTQLGIRIWCPSIHIYSKKWFFGLQNTIVPPKHMEFFFFSTLNIMILQMVRNEYVRFSGHVDMQVSYKILQLEVPKKTPILQNLPCFQEGLF